MHAATSCWSECAMLCTPSVLERICKACSRLSSSALEMITHVPSLLERGLLADSAIVRHPGVRQRTAGHHQHVEDQKKVGDQP